MADQLPVYWDATAKRFKRFQTGDTVAVANGGTGQTSIAAMKTAFNLVTGVDIQAWDADLDAYAALSTTGLVARTGAGTVATRTLTQPAAGITVSNGNGVSGNPTLALANDLAAVEGLSGTGFGVRTASDTWANRSLTQPAAGLTITNPAGVAGDPTFALANDLAALEGLGSTGIAVRTAADTWAQRSVATASSARITVANGDGASGNPTVDLATVTDAGTGTFLKLTRDGYGRVSGTTAVVAGDITALVDSVYVNVTGDTMTGYLTLHADPSNAMHAATKQYVDAVAASGAAPWFSVRAMATGNVNISNPGTAVFDGVTLSNGDRILLPLQSTGTQNGIYIFNGSGSAMTRAPDADISSEMLPGKSVWVNEGTAYGDSEWTLITDAPITLGSTSLTFTKTNSLGQVIAGAGLVKDAFSNQLDVGTASSARIVVNADNIDLATVSDSGTGTFLKTAFDSYGRKTGTTAVVWSDISALNANISALGALNSDPGIIVQTGAATFARRTLAAPAAGITISNPAGTAGNPTFALADDLAGLEALSTTGSVVRTGANTYTTRSMTQPAAGITITNPDGVAGVPTFALANDLAAIEGLSSNGMAVRTGTDTWDVRTITGTGGRIDVSNGNGVSGNPTIDLIASGVTPGTYQGITFDTFGRATSAVNWTPESTLSQATNGEAGAIVIGRALYVSASGTVRLANANATGTADVLGLVADTSINSSATGNIITAGVLTATTGQWDVVTGQSGGLTFNAIYYLSNTTAGALTTTPPASGFVCPVGQALSTTKMRVGVGPVLQL